MTKYRPQNRSQGSQSQQCKKCKKKSNYRCPKSRLPYCSLPCYKGLQKDLEEGKIKPADPSKDDKATAQSGRQMDTNTNDKSASPREQPYRGSRAGFHTQVRTDSWARFDTDEDRLSKERLDLLEKSDEVKNMLANPHLRQMLDHLYTSRNKDRGMEQAMQEPIFVEFADACLNLVESPDISDGEKTLEPKEEDTVEVREFEMLQF